MKTIILASGSPRRKELLLRAGLNFIVDPSSYNEYMTKKVPPKELVKHLSKGKASDIAKKHSNALVIGADTIVVYKNRVLGKPQDPDDARKILNMLSGQQHTVITGYTIIDTDTGEDISRAVETKVFFKKLTKADIDEYLKSGEPMGHAGAYAIQGLGGKLVKKYEGDYHTIIGLPIGNLLEDFEKFGVRTKRD